MAQVKIYGERGHLTTHRQALSDTIHAVNQEVLGLPEGKRFHRFIALEAADFVHPADRSGAYTVIEISMFEGRDPQTKRRLLRRLMEALSTGLGISTQDIEITIFETPKANWGIRGKVADELTLDYSVEV